MKKAIMKLLLGTNNPGKISEISDLLKGLPLELLTPTDLSLFLQVNESGENYLENASLKARKWSLESGLACLADDSGLEVDALDGAPGLFSHRFTGNPNATDAERRKFLLQCLENKPQPWTAHFRCAVAIDIPGQDMIQTIGSCYGMIIAEERGMNGFGYDPIFLVQGTNKTMAELGMEEKNVLSHRANAVGKARSILTERFVNCLLPKEN
jgi:XTP/dITP diphosphohydrolase